MVLYLPRSTSLSPTDSNKSTNSSSSGNSSGLLVLGRPNSNMYPSSNRVVHPHHQNFGLTPVYGYGGQQAAAVSGAGGHHHHQYVGSPSDMHGCAVAAHQYQMDALQQGPSWHTPAVYMSSCARGPVTFDPVEWQQQHQGLHQGGAPSSPFGLQGPPSSSSSVSSYNKLLAGEAPPPNPPEEYSSGGGGGQQVDLTHSPADSGLTASSDGGVSSSDSPLHVHNQHVQQQQQQQQQHVHQQHHVHNNNNNNNGGVSHVHGHHVVVQGGVGVGVGGGGGMNRPVPVRSPFEWMKTKTAAFPNQQNSGHPRSGSKGLDALLTEGGKTRTKDKYRVVYSDHQRLELEKEFHYSRYITIRRKAELAQALGLSERQVKIWFQNRRAKERKQGKKQNELKIKDPGLMGPNSIQVSPGHGAVCRKKLDGIQQRDVEQYESSLRPRPTLALGDIGPSYTSATTTFL